MNYQLFKKSLLQGAAIILASLGLSAQGMHVTPGCNLVMSGAVNLVLNNAGFTNDGNVVAGKSTITFTGDATSGTLFAGNSGSVTAYNNITINKSAGDVRVTHSNSIAGSLTMTKGNFILDSGYFSLSGGKIAGENEQSHITSAGSGQILILTSLNAPNRLNPGNIGIEITTAASPGLTFIYRFPAGALLPNGTRSIARTFQIVPIGTNTGLNATLRFHYLHAEIGTQKEKNFVIWADSSAAGWGPGRADSLDTFNDVVTETGINVFKLFTVSEATATARKITSAAANNATAAGRPGSPALQVLPNPARDRFTLVLTATEEKDEAVGLYDITGHLLQRKQIRYHAGVNEIEWDISSYAAGVYYLHFESLAVKNISIIKQ